MGREGEVIFRYIYDYIKCRKPVKRLWISSLTDESILNGMNNLIDGKEKDTLYEAGYARSRIDWLFGMNMSRLYTMLYKTAYSIGRVQTPTVNMIVQRDMEIANFKKSLYYTLKLDNGAEYYTEDGESTFSEKRKAELVKQSCINKNAKVIKSETKEKTENRPLLYSLTSLQKEANEKHGFSAARTLVTMQSLYEKKLFSYPRTDSNYITDDMKDDISEIVSRLKFCAKSQFGTICSEQVEKLLTEQGLNLDKRVVDNSKVQDHTAIIPTKEIERLKTAELNPDEKIIADMLLSRLLTTLDKPYIYSETEYIFKVENYYFKLVTRKPVRLGFKSYSNPDFTEKSDVKDVYENSDNYYIKDIAVTEKETAPPKPFTESTLLSAMENIDKRIEDTDKKQFVKERGVPLALGTPATRAAIIERILKLGYVERKNKNIVSSAAGRSFIEILPDDVKSVEMTAEMEMLLSDIENNIISSNYALNGITDLIKKIIQSEKRKNIQPTENNTLVSLGDCPKCKGKVVERKLTFSCENSGKMRSTNFP